MGCEDCRWSSRWSPSSRRTRSSISYKVNTMTHYDDIIMSTMTRQITSLPIVYSTVYSGADQRKHQSSASLVFVRVIHRLPVTGEFPAQSQRASSAENVSIWWRHRVLLMSRCKDSRHCIILNFNISNYAITDWLLYIWIYLARERQICRIVHK